jgi:hypothetical protein
MKSESLNLQETSGNVQVLPFPLHFRKDQKDMAYILSVMSMAMEGLGCEDVPGHFRHAIDGYASLELAVRSRS